MTSIRDFKIKGQKAQQQKAQQQKRERGALWFNSKKGNGSNQPDLRGPLPVHYTQDDIAAGQVEGIDPNMAVNYPNGIKLELWLSGWFSESQKGNDYISILCQPAEKQDEKTPF